MDESERESRIWTGLYTHCRCHAADTVHTQQPSGCVDTHKGHIQPWALNEHMRKTCTPHKTPVTASMAEDQEQVSCENITDMIPVIVDCVCVLKKKPSSVVWSVCECVRVFKETFLCCLLCECVCVCVCVHVCVSLRKL